MGVSFESRTHNADEQWTSSMPQLQKNTQNAPDYRARLRHSVILLVLLDLATLGIYSAARCYPLHTELSLKCGRRLFSPAFLHINVLLNLLLAILRYSRNSMPWDTSVMMAQFGATLLMISLLFIFRLALHDEYKLWMRPLPLAVFGFWYLQFQINRGHEYDAKPKESRWVTAIAFLLALATRMALVAALWAVF
jgi:hypothetical protein